MKYEITVHGALRAVEIEPVRPGVYRICWGDGEAREEHTVDVYRPSPEAFQVLIDGESWEAGCVSLGPDRYMVDVVGVSTEVEVVDPRRKALRISGGAGSGTISTSMPGRIVRLMGAVGDRVTKGQPVIVSAGPLAGQEIPVAAMGLGYPVIIQSNPVKKVKVITSQKPAGEKKPAAGKKGPGAPDEGADEPDQIELKRYDFVLQFCWQPKVVGPPAAAAAGGDAAAP